MMGVAARRGSDGWRPTFDNGYVKARDQGLEKQRTRDCSNVFNIIASQSLLRFPVLPIPAAILSQHLCASKYVFLLFIRFIFL